MNHTLLKVVFLFLNQILPLSSSCMLSTQNILYQKKYSSRHWFNPLSSSNLVFVKEICNSAFKWVCLSSQKSPSEPVPQSLTASGPNPNPGPDPAHHSTRGWGFSPCSHWPNFIIFPTGHNCITPPNCSTSPSEPQLSCSSGSSIYLKHLIKTRHL